MKLHSIFISAFVLVSVLEHQRTKYLLVDIEGSERGTRTDDDEFRKPGGWKDDDDFRNPSGRKDDDPFRQPPNPPQGGRIEHSDCSDCITCPITAMMCEATKCCACPGHCPTGDRFTNLRAGCAKKAQRCQPSNAAYPPCCENLECRLHGFDNQICLPKLSTSLKLRIQERCTSNSDCGPDGWCSMGMCTI